MLMLAIGNYPIPVSREQKCVIDVAQSKKIIQRVKKERHKNNKQEREKIYVNPPMSTTAWIERERVIEMTYVRKQSACCQQKAKKASNQKNPIKMYCSHLNMYVTYWNKNI